MSESRRPIRTGVAVAEPAGDDKPLAKPVAAGVIVQPVGTVRPQLRTETFLPFACDVALDELTTALKTTGFDGFEDERHDPQSADSAVASTTPIVIVPAKPLLEVKPTNVSAAIYEPMEFLDFDEEEDDSFAPVEPEPEPAATFEPPRALTTFFAVTKPKDAAPAPAPLQEGFAATPFLDAPVKLPELSLQTLRRKLCRGANPFQPKTDFVSAAPSQIPESKPASQAKVPSSPVSKPGPVITKPATPASPKVSPNVTQRPAAAAATAPGIKAEPTRTEPARAEKDKRSAAKAAPILTPQKPVVDRGNAVPVEEPVDDVPPVSKPKMVPIRKPEPVAPAAAQIEAPMIGLPPTERSGGSKIAIIAAVVVALAGGGYMMFSGGSTSGSPAAEATDSSAPGMIVGGGGWTTTWGSETPSNKGKQISIYRPSMPMSDYRFEFRGQIERKALGWIFRASNPKNYYVMKLETIKTGANPLVALVKYAVIDGKDTTRTQVLLPFEVKLGTIYQVRLDVRGDKFATYINDKLIDHWTDDRVKVGGAGFYTETGERSQIKSSQVSYLR